MRYAILKGRNFFSLPFSEDRGMLIRTSVIIHLRRPGCFNICLHFCEMICEPLDTQRVSTAMLK